MLVFVAVLLLLVRVCVYSISGGRKQARKSQTAGLAVFLGSGGHTTEALKLVSSLDFSRYSPRTYIVSSGDSLSVEKAVELETSSSSPGNYTVLVIPRARRVHQSLITTPPTVVLSLLFSIYHISLAPIFSARNRFADVLILNGPGSCVVLCNAVYISKFLGLPSPKTIYVESFARVRSLSLSGWLLRPFVDRFIVQWPDLLSDNGRGEYHGWLV